jgi:hypothetical protein
MSEQYPVGLPKLAQPRSPFSTQPLRDRPSDRLRCDRTIPNNPKKRIASA